MSKSEENEAKKMKKRKSMKESGKWMKYQSKSENHNVMWKWKHQYSEYQIIEIIKEEE